MGHSRLAQVGSNMAKSCSRVNSEHIPILPRYKSDSTWTNSRSPLGQHCRTSSPECSRSRNNVCVPYLHHCHQLNYMIIYYTEAPLVFHWKPCSQDSHHAYNVVPSLCQEKRIKKRMPTPDLDFFFVNSETYGVQIQREKMRKLLQI